MDKDVALTSVIIVFAVIFIVGVFFLHSDNNEEALEDTVQGMVITPLVKGCAETEQGVNSVKGEGRGTDVDGVDEKPSIKFDNGIIYYTHALNHMCCRKVVLSAEKRENIIDISETWSGSGCKCMCFSNISMTVQSLSPGTYSVTVWEKGIQPITGEQMSVEPLLREEVSI